MRALLAGLVLAASLPAMPAVSAKAPSPVTAVVGIVDTGINPYHAMFRDTSPRAQQHPSTYLPGYPKNAVALRLSLHKKDYWDAIDADCERVWSKVRPGTLYWFPGTRIVGGISFSKGLKVDCEAEKPTGIYVLDENGHGTMTASRAAASAYGACRTCLVVAAQHPSSVAIASPGGSEEPSIAAIEWLAANAHWVDTQSNSWGPIAPGYDPTGAAGLMTANNRLNKAVEAVSKKHLAFWASGNGAAFRYGLVGHPTLLTPHLGPSALIVGGHDSGYVATWPGFTPHLVGDACSSMAARHQTMRDSGDTVGSGTSAATPYVAGGAAQILMHARTILGSRGTGVRNGVVASGRKGLVKTGPLADGVLTMAEWRAVTLAVGAPRPAGQDEDGPPCTTGAPYHPLPAQWSAVPAAFPEYVLIGYGALDRAAVLGARDVLLGRKPMPQRPATDAYFERDRQVRETTGAVFRG